MLRSHSYLALSWFVFAVLCTAPGQSTTPLPEPAAAPGIQAPPEPANTFRIKVEEVSLDLIARGKDGKAVIDLQPTDVLITDNQVPVKLTRFLLVQGAPEADHLVTLVFDRMDPGPTRFARQMAGKILSEFPEKGYAYAVLVMSGRLHLLQGYTTDHKLLDMAVGAATGDLPASALDRYTAAEKEAMAEAAESGALPPEQKERTRARLLMAAMIESQRIPRDEHTFPSLSALLILTQHQQQVSGRKIIVYFCQGLHVSNDSVDAARSVVAQANRAGVSIVTVDTDFVNAQMGGEMAAAAAVANIGVSDFMTGADLAAAHQDKGPAYMMGGRIVWIPGVSGGAPPPGSVAMDQGTLEKISRNMMKLEFAGADGAEGPLAALAYATGSILQSGGQHQEVPCAAP